MSNPLELSIELGGCYSKYTSAPLHLSVYNGAVDFSVFSKNKGGGGDLFASVLDLPLLQVECLFLGWTIFPGKYITLLREKFLGYCHMTKCSYSPKLNRISVNE